MYVMGNNNGPKDYNEFPQALAPNEIEIKDVTSCTDMQYVTLVGGDGIRSVGVSSNLSFTECILSVPKLEVNNLEATSKIETPVLEAETIMTSIKEPTTELPVSLASGDGVYADANLKYDPTTCTLCGVNTAFTNANIAEASITDASITNIVTSEVQNTWTPIYENTPVCYFELGPKVFISAGASAKQCDVYDAIKKYVSVGTIEPVSVCGAVTVTYMCHSSNPGSDTHWVKFYDADETAQMTIWENCNSTIANALSIELWR